MTILDRAECEACTLNSCENNVYTVIQDSTVI